ncbi:TlpA family protein disulfide reductase [Pseudoalteromonas tunicata]|jgi:thiol-disulfide isomerase/thioredoxin|uniref:Thioredoxin domain-containing protein n=1 Tax=Pseudoalteromonas tunicata D2 TaxID=87626 RepID=A4CAJ3_9GAMM|nr:redoxin family protein [Pseudoalteromonas tunicata]ATC94947.1 hypothetical protein PTUN_a2474 [Pseudoalteromonas tunicata]EAR28401.1 hypothetical protein PTD2_21337 [Pseudoalteromonas tunicata D2]
MRKIFYLLLCLVLVQPVIAKATDLQLVELRTFPSFTSVNLSTLPKDKPLYVKMWASWCKPCMEQMPHFQSLYQRFGDKVNFIAVNIDFNEKPEEVSAVIERFGLTMPIWTDAKGQLALELGLVGTPYSVLMNNQGQQVYTSHESDKVLGGFIERLAQGQNLPLASSDSVSVSEQNRLLAPYQRGEHYLFFSATWCDWYLADSRPKMAAQCKNAQQGLDSLAAKLPNVNWTGIVNHLWTDDKALAEFNVKYEMKLPFKIDHNGVLFQQFNIRKIPVLLKVKDGKVLTEISDFTDSAAVIARLKKVH